MKIHIANIQWKDPEHYFIYLFIYLLGFQLHQQLHGQMSTSGFYWWRKIPRISEFACTGRTTSFWPDWDSNPCGEGLNYYKSKTVTFDHGRYVDARLMQNISLFRWCIARELSRYQRTITSLTFQQSISYCAQITNLCDVASWVS